MTTMNIRLLQYIGIHFLLLVMEIPRIHRVEHSLLFTQWYFSSSNAVKTAVGGVILLLNGIASRIDIFHRRRKAALHLKRKSYYHMKITLLFYYFHTRLQVHCFPGESPSTLFFKTICFFNT